MVSSICCGTDNIILSAELLQRCRLPQTYSFLPLIMFYSAVYSFSVNYYKQSVFLCSQCSSHSWKPLWAKPSPRTGFKDQLRNVRLWFTVCPGWLPFKAPFGFYSHFQGFMRAVGSFTGHEDEANTVIYRRLPRSIRTRISPFNF